MRDLAVRDVLLRAAGTLATADVPDPELDAEALLRHALGWDRAALLASLGEPLEPAAEHRLAALVAARSRRVPLQHLLGSVEFWRRRFCVSPDALVPRPETELLVEIALQLLAGRCAPVVVDVGTGSGCIALSLAADRPDAVLHATDVSERALALARRNAEALGLAGRVDLHLGDLLEPVAALAGGVDLVASNPPYVDAGEIEALMPEVRDHEPRLALVPPDGDRYSVYRRLAPAAAGVLAPGGVLVVEIGQGMDADVARICREAGFDVERVADDIRRIPRTLVARLR